MADSPEDAQLVHAARAGDRRAFEALVQRFERPVFNLALRMLGRYEDAEDAAQDVFIKAHRALSAYDANRPFSTWLLSIAAHHCIDRIRRRRLQEVSLDAMPPWRQPAARSIDPEDEAIYQDHASRVKAVLQKLPDDHRLVVVLLYWHDFGYAEIAELTGESESAIKSRLHRARRQLARLLTDGDDAALDVAAPPAARESTAGAERVAAGPISGAGRGLAAESHSR